MVKIGGNKKGIPRDSFELDGAGNGIRTRDFNLGKIEKYITRKFKKYH